MLKDGLNRLYLRVSQFASEPVDSEEWKIKRSIGVTAAAGASAGYLGYAVLYWTFKEPMAGTVCLAASLLFALGILSYRIFRHYAAHWYIWAVIVVLSITGVHVALGGFVRSGMVMVYILFVPVANLVVYKPRHSTLWFVVVAVIYLGAALLEPSYVRSSNNLPQGLLSTLYVMNALGSAMFMILSMYYYIWRNEILGRLLAAEQGKTEALLANVLPREIASILKNESRVIADHYDGVSVLFADVVNFTPLSTRLTPAELVDLLNDVFSYFDGLADKYEVEKIKTIGDCYMVAAGVPRRRSDHAHVLTRMAIDMRDYTARNDFRGRRLAFRFGLNSGPVVAGVIGRKKFIYDLWGDAVNTASRMESHGSEGTIQITEATYELIKGDFVCEPRGAVNIKGKGEMRVWSVRGDAGSV